MEEVAAPYQPLPPAVTNDMLFKTFEAFCISTASSAVHSNIVQDVGWFVVALLILTIMVVCGFLVPKELLKRYKQRKLVYAEVRWVCI